MIAYGIGISVYFGLPNEPGHWIWLSALLFSVLAVLIFNRKDYFQGVVAATLVCAALMGIGRSVLHTDMTKTTQLPSYERTYDVTGEILAIEKSGPRQRWVLKPLTIGQYDEEKLPRLIRVTTFDRTLRVGDRAAFRAALSKPKGAAVPGGYNPGFTAFYKKIGATGYMLSKPEVLSPGSGRKSMTTMIAQMRYGLANRIRAAAPPETAGLQVALLTGIRTWVTDDQTESLRAGGLAHILAISGLHMGLIAGGVFAFTVKVLARIPRLAAGTDIRKYAAIVGFMVATAYLIVSGAGVATQRAYIMACIVFAAMLLDRQAISVRSVAVAAFLTLTLHPEALLSPGFQMSFSAVIALVVVYRALDERREYKGPKTWFGKFVDNFKALTITSFVAGGATSGFAVLHFNRIAGYGLAGNLFAMPIFTFWVMPVGVFVYLALPFGLERYPLWVMGEGLELILAVSDRVWALPGAVKYIASGPVWTPALFGLAFIGLCLGRPKIRALSTVVLIGCFVLIAITPQPDIRISDKGALAFWEGRQSPKLWVDRKQSDRYGRQQFIEAMGMEYVETETFDGSLADCDALACVLEFKEYRIIIVRNPEEIMDDCPGADLILAPKRNLGNRIRRLCGAKIIDADELSQQGAHSLYLGAAGIKIRTARPQGKRRPWD